VSRVACIIPVVGRTEGLENTLLSVLERRPDNCEIIVTTSVLYDDPYKLQGEIQILELRPHSELVDCVNLGIHSTTAPIVHILAGGAQATEGWIDRAAEHFDNPCVAAVVPFVHDADNSARLLSAGVSYLGHGRKQICRSAAPVEPPIGPQLGAAFYRKSAIDAIGGVPTGVGDALADVDLALTLRKAGWQIELEPECRVLAQQVDDCSPGSFRSALCCERLYWRHFVDDGIAAWLAHPFVQLADIIRTRLQGELSDERGRSVCPGFAGAQAGLGDQHSDWLRACHQGSRNSPNTSRMASATSPLVAPALTASMIGKIMLFSSLSGARATRRTDSNAVATACWSRRDLYARSLAIRSSTTAAGAGQ
jgi:hypothetical protein